MIRKYEAKDLPELLDAWYEASRLAHPFLDDGFFEAERRAIPEKYVPIAETWVYEQAGRVVGFIVSIGHEVGALFVPPRLHGQGLGRALMDYTHAIFAGPGVHASLKSLFVPATQAKPQPGVDGNKAILKFVAWEEAAWSKFLNDELDMGTESASAIWIANFWKALDRMYGGGNLLDPAPQ